MEKRVTLTKAGRSGSCFPTDDVLLQSSCEGIIGAVGRQSVCLSFFPFDPVSSFPDFPCIEHFWSIFSPSLSPVCNGRCVISRFGGWRPASQSFARPPWATPPVRAQQPVPHLWGLCCGRTVYVHMCGNPTRHYSFCLTQPTTF